ncbi:MAG: hypothetical protein WCP21_19315, partial [Armatimonadota bacterium]
MRYLIAGCILLAATLSVASAAPVNWPMDDQSEIVNALNMEPCRVQNGRLMGATAWDPHFGLKIPREGFDPQALTWLETRLYSSAPADLLDIYYKSADGRWCLGGKFPIARGWAVYRVDLTKNAWRETTTGDASRQWGGPSHQVSAFRLDPGNEAGRVVMADYVTLMPKPEGAVEGVTLEPTGQATLRGLRVPPQAQAGEKLSVSADFALQVPPEPKRLTSYVRLR